MEGVVKFFLHERRFGFIVTADQTEYYFHGDDFQGPMPRTLRYVKVKFDPMLGQRSLRARNVIVKA